MVEKLNADPKKIPRPLGELGEPSREMVSASELKYGKGTQIFGQAEPAIYVYQVIEGAARSHKLLSDGRRQIGAFHLPGDIFGFENGDVHRFTAEAIIDTTLRLVEDQRLARTDPAMVRRLLTLTTESLRHVEDHILLLGRQSAPERVAAFLLEMNGRVIAGGVLSLPMDRRDCPSSGNLRLIRRFEKRGSGSSGVRV
jgi:CRP/FNR family transcriptional regulator, nitrogen fixation regulation protein